MKKLPEQKTFTWKCLAHKVEKNQNEINVIKASIKDLSIFSKDELKNNPSFMFFEADLANAGKINKNGYGMTIQEAVRVYKNWEYGFMNIEHSRSDICGVIIKAALTDPETHKILTDEEALKSDKPINISVGFIVWENVDPGLTEVLKEVGQVNNSSHGLISLSLELAYNEFDIYKGNDDNMFSGEIISNEEDIEKIYKNLKEFDGSGKDEDGNRLCLIPQNIVPLGAGLVVKPAADVKGIKQVMADCGECEDDDHNDDCECEDCLKNKEVSASNKEIIIPVRTKVEIINMKDLEEIEKKVNILEEKIEKFKNIEILGSQIEKNNVSTHSMKINKISDITDEVLKEIKANDISSFLADEIAKASEKALEDIRAKEEEAKVAKAAADSALEEVKTLKESLDKVSQELTDIKASRDAERVENEYNSRMALLDEEFELDDASRQAIASQIQGLDDEGFAAWKKSFDIFATEKNKEVIKSKKEKEEEKKKENKKEGEMKASLEDPLDEIVNKIKAAVPSSVEVISKDTIESYKEAFGVGKGITIEL